MYITCPNCNFQRSVDENQIPSSATVVTCPKCENKFRFRDVESGAFLPEVCAEEMAEIKPEEVKNSFEKIEQDPSNQSLIKPDAKGEEGISNSQDNLQEEPAQPQNNYGEDKEPLNEDELTKNSKFEEQSFIQDEINSEKKPKLQMMTDDVPWEHPERYGMFGSLFQTIARVMFKAPMFFKTIHSHSSMLRPATFYALLTLFQTLCLQIWLSTLDSVEILAQNPVMQESVSQYSTPMTIAISPFLAIFQLLLYSSFLYLAIRITNPDKADYNLTLRVIAYAYAPTILSVVPYFGPMVGLIWFICNIFIGVKYAFELSWQRTFLALSPVFILWLFLIVNSLNYLLP